jgi:poly-gamma-glutamate synthesis protein (capsule biosynthesis protein)
VRNPQSGSRRTGEGVFRLPWRSLSVLLTLILLVVLPLLLSHSGSCDSSYLSVYPWLYLRDGEPPTGADDAVAVVAVGDVMLGRGLADEPRPFRAIGSWLQTADIALGNLECVISASSSPQASEDSPFPGPLRADPSVTSILRRAGFDLLGLANNHALDLGSEGLAETVSRLEQVGIATVGAGIDPTSAFQPVMYKVEGVRLAFLAFNAVPHGRDESGWMQADWDLERATAAVRAARDEADAVIVSVHWGYEYETRVDPIQRRAARSLLEAGADLVIGHHPHVVQTLEVREGRGICYSLGNFVFDQGQGETGLGLALRAFFDGDGLRAVQALPVWAGRRPRLATAAEARSIIARVEGQPRRTAYVCDRMLCRLAEPAPDAPAPMRSGLFWGGRTDLTGDGTAEHVRRVDERVIIYEDGAEVWRSPAEWRVVDLALGDPNDDGRNELMLALWKPGLDGLEPPSDWKERAYRSRPFIVGYRGGIYRTVWGGSAVSHPIHELELGDVDGDLAEELVVLEAHGDGLQDRTVSVWRWHGWGFSKVWRSPPGQYSDLVLRNDGMIEISAK